MPRPTDRVNHYSSSHYFPFCLFIFVFENRDPFLFLFWSSSIAVLHSSLSLLLHQTFREEAKATHGSHATEAKEGEGEGEKRMKWNVREKAGLQEDLLFLFLEKRNLLERREPHPFYILLLFLPSLVLFHTINFMYIKGSKPYGQKEELKKHRANCCDVTEGSSRSR